MPFNNSTNLTADFAGPATMTDALPNDDVDAALGYGRNPNDDFMTAFGKAFQAGQFRNTDEGRKLTADFAKQKLANQLAEQLMQRKYELAQKYEPYSHFFNLPNGAVVGVGQQGAKEMYNNPAMAEGWAAKNKAEIAKDTFEASPEHIKSLQQEDKLKSEHLQSQIDLNKATTDIYRPAEAGLANARVEALKNPRPKFATYKDALAAAFEEEGINLKDPRFSYLLSKGDPATTQRMQRAKARAQELYSQQGTPSGIAAPGAAQAPDLTGAFAPLDVQ